MDRILLRKTSLISVEESCLCAQKNGGNSRKQKGSSCAVLQLFRDLHVFIYERGEKAGTRQDFILQSRDAKGHNMSIMILWSGLS